VSRRREQAKRVICEIARTLIAAGIIPSLFDQAAEKLIYQIYEAGLEFQRKIARMIG